MRNNLTELGVVVVTSILLMYALLSIIFIQRGSLNRLQGLLYDLQVSSCRLDAENATMLQACIIRIDTPHGH